jgi:DNA invertase Pin-like site-specific DNA recombinase
MEIGYARVSTQDQHPALHLDALHAAGCAKVFVEQASGAQRDRPPLQAALDDARSGDTLVVWKLDRLARSLKQLIETIELLAAREIGFRSLTEAIETATAGGRLVFHIFASLAEFERAIIRERTRAGLDAARARGRQGGRPPALTARELTAAKARLADPTLTVEDVA